MQALLAKTDIRDALTEARKRTWLLMEGLPDDLLGRAACGYLSPPTWDLGHIANFEELWLVQRLGGRSEMRAGYNDTYNAFEHPRPERPNLELLDREGVRAYMGEVRQRTFAVLDEVELNADRLTRDGFVYWMLVLHEHQHQETLLQTLQMTGDAYRPPPARSLPEPVSVSLGWVDVPGGSFTMGRAPGPGAYDNESPAHERDVPEFQIARYPVTCGEYLAFVESGYAEEEHWSKRGRIWLEEGNRGPLYWRKEGRKWQRRNMHGWAPVEAVSDEILCHVSYWEAEAYAAWAGARLPTEAEWEKACPRPDVSLETANIDQLGLGPSRIGAYPFDGPAHMIGDVWEWCSDGFEPYPGFKAYPYPEYSEVFFGGDYKILRGGSWATRAGCATPTFRNWDHPYRRQVFSGIRLARDASPS